MGKTKLGLAVKIMEYFMIQPINECEKLTYCSIPKTYVNCNAAFYIEIVLVNDDVGSTTFHTKKSEKVPLLHAAAHDADSTALIFAAAAATPSTRNATLLNEASVADICSMYTASSSQQQQQQLRTRLSGGENNWIAFIK